MPAVMVTTLDGTEHRLEARTGGTLMEVIRDHGIDDLLAICGGTCSCGTCRVYINGAELFAGYPKISDDEDAMLETSSQPRQSRRLSCQIVLSDTLEECT